MTAPVPQHLVPSISGPQAAEWAVPPSQAELVAELRRRCEAVGFSLARLCRNADVAHTTPARWESGATALRWDLYHRLCSALLEIEALHSAPAAAPSGGKPGNLAALPRVHGEGAEGVAVSSSPRIDGSVTPCPGAAGLPVSCSPRIPGAAA